jgi:hypothetical protein
MLVWMGMGGVMRVLLAIFSAHKYEYTLAGYRDWFTRPVVDRVKGLRESWLQDVNIDYKIFKGQSRGTILPDEVFLSGVIDDYHHSADKLRSILKYTLDRGYQKLIKIDDDVFAYFDRLMSALPEFESADYVGGGRGGDVKGDLSSFRTDFIPGFTYILSERAMRAALDSPDGVFAEDRWLGESLRRKGIYPTFDERFYLVRPTRTNQYISDEDLEKVNNYFTIHSLSPEQMRRLWKSTQTSVAS